MRIRRRTTTAFIVAAVTVPIVWWMVENHSESSASIPTAVTSPARAESEASRASKNDQHPAALSPARSEEKQEIHEGEAEARLRMLDIKLKATERENAHLVWSGVVADHFNAYVVALSQPTTEQYNEMNSVMEDSLAGLDRQGPGFLAARAAHQRLFLSYVSYPRKVRLLYFLVEASGSFHSLQVSHVDREDEATPKPNGMGPGKGKVRGYSGPWTKGNGGYDRYSHLFNSKLEPIPGQSTGR